MRSKSGVTALGLTILLTAYGCSDSSAPPESHQSPRDRIPATPASGGRTPPGRQSLARFRELASDAAINFTYRNGEEAGQFAILESLGGGAGLFDYDGDGHLDLFLPGGGTLDSRLETTGLPSALYRNNGEWRFTAVSQPAGIDQAGHYSHGVAAADFDNDGFVDVLVTGYGGLTFFQDQGDGTFRDTTRVVGLDDRLWSSSAAWGDIDHDGDLDLYVVHYVNWSRGNHPFCKGPKPTDREVCPPRSFEGLPDTLYENLGDGTFRDRSQEAGLRPDGKGLGIVMADVDLDGDLDIYVSNDTVPNFLYLNDGTGRFHEAGMNSGTALNDAGAPDGSMGTDLGDFDGDGLPDLWVVNYERESFALYRNEGNCFFQHVSQSMGVTALGGLYVGWGTAFLDFDRDGDEDLFVSNGHVIRYPVNAPLRQTPLVIENVSGKRVINVSSGAGEYMTVPHMGRGAAVGDIDDDGDLDLAVVHTNEPVALLSNESPNDNQWISLRLIGIQSSREPIGAVVRLTTAVGPQIRQVKGGTSYASTSDRRLFFGLGRAAQIEKLDIVWPSGLLQSLSGLQPGSMTIIESATTGQ